MKRVDVSLIALYGRKGVGKSTLAIWFAIQYWLQNRDASIHSNIKLAIPGVPSVHIRTVNELIQECNNDPCTCAPRIVIVDEFDKSFTSRIGWVEKEREQKLVELVSNIRKHNTIAFIATSQLKKKIKNDFRLNCDYVVEPTGMLDGAACPEYFIWSDIELYESAGKGRYQAADHCASDLPLSFLEQTFNTRQIIPLEWQ